MKADAHTVATLFHSRAVRRAQDDGTPPDPQPQPGTNQEPMIRILSLDDDQGLPEEWPDPPGSPPASPEDPPKDAAWLHLLGIAVILYLLALMFMLFQ